MQNGASYTHFAALANERTSCGIRKTANVKYSSRVSKVTCPDCRNALGLKDTGSDAGDA